MSHLTNDEIVDAVERTLRPARLHHVDGCANCRAQVDRVAAILRQVQTTEVPEPSPLFWAPFSQRVREAVAEQGAQGWLWPEWLRAPALAPIAAMALVVFALVTTVSRESAVPQSQVASAEAVMEVASLEQEWAVVADMVGEIDIETAQQAGIELRHGSVERAALELGATEQQELVRLMREEIEKAGG